MEQARLAVGLELAPQVGDEDVDGVRLLERVIAPDVFEQPLPGDDQLLVACQVLEQLELPVGQLYLPLAALHLASIRVEEQVAHHDRGAASRWTAAQQCSDPGQ